MDNKGYAFTPLVLLLFIPVIIIGLSFSSLVNELNTISSTAIGGDVTLTTANTIYTSIKEGATDAGRNGAYNATRKVIDDQVYLTDSRTYIRDQVVTSLNSYVIANCKALETQTGRSIYINNISVDNYTTQVFSSNDVNITQDDPFGFYVSVKGVPIQVNQTNQSYTGTTAPITVYVSIEGLEDPYIWLNSKERTTSVIYKYPYYTTYAGANYHFADAGVKQNQLFYLWDAMNGTNNPSNISRPYYFVDPNGLSFFDRLENKTVSTSHSAPNTKMSTFIMGDPLLEDHSSNPAISFIDHEYFSGLAGSIITTKSGNVNQPSGGGPYGIPVYLSSPYKIQLGLNGSPYPLT
ncbi:MAG: hypothetical protein NKF70_00670 [Methanobacterium sp. ERen5]|nr:MAG: hypothetical protein NKF70_00670 [Methanobacterium sp. ERen5]